MTNTTNMTESMVVLNAVRDLNAQFLRYTHDYPALESDIVAFGGDAKRKEDALALVEAHKKADMIVQGQYWETHYDNGRTQIGGCAVGCLTHGENHGDFRDLYGIPTELAMQADNLFEALDSETAKSFPVEFIRAIPVGADVSGVQKVLKEEAIAEYVEAHPELTSEQIKQLSAPRRIISTELAGFSLGTQQDVYLLNRGDLDDIYRWKFNKPGDSNECGFNDAYIEEMARAAAYVLPIFLQALRDAPVTK
jgi:hypothetical protein